MNLGFAIFMLFVFASLGYVWWRIRRSFRPRHRSKLTLIYWVSTALAMGSQAIPLELPFLHLIGFYFSTVWMVIISLLFPAVILADMVLLLIKLSRKMQAPDLMDWRNQYAKYFLSAILLLAGVFSAIGIPASRGFVVNHYEVQSAVSMPRTLKIAAVADPHFNAVFPLRKLESLVDSLQKIKPDIVVFLGDVSDIPESELNRRGFTPVMKKIQAPMGVFGVTGNHEVYMSMRGGNTIPWMEKTGMHLLRDKTLCLEGLCLSGREDLQYERSLGYIRTSLNQLAPNTTPRLPWIVMDHQPKGLTDEEIEAIPGMVQKPDLVLSGHTHAGQFFPWTLVMPLIWPLSSGLGEVDGLPWFVSSGIGQWGPPVRIGSETELAIIHLRSAD